eukprot:maker-scaffold810_size94089-snap-gene-0.18 protein:Tk05704 transcript:maker-scaffold810_size94089-snap-gene-0.18-mRNA-1 annotation:"ets dna-binding protein pokkuri"
MLGSENTPSTWTEDSSSCDPPWYARLQYPLHPHGHHKHLERQSPSTFRKLDREHERMTMVKGPERSTTTIVISEKESSGIMIGEPVLAKDPRLWSRDEVRDWILLLARRHSLPEVHPERFLMNGKALCLMNVSMFTYRVPLGGKLLFKDFQLRLSKAIYAEETRTKRTLGFN